MKTYTYEEITKAERQLPRPVRDFLGSDALTKIIDGIRKKLDLDYPQMTRALSVITATLVTLEPESAFETNIHQVLPELSNEKTRELVADINDRVFKEAKRRLEQNITEPRYDWDESILGSPLTPEEIERDKARRRQEAAHPTPAEELKRRAEKEAREIEEREDREDAEYAAAQKALGLPTPEEILAAAEAAAASGSELPSIVSALTPTTALPAAPVPLVPTPKLTPPTLNLPPKTLPIATQKLAAPTIQQTGQTQIDAGLGRPGISSVAMPDAPAKPQNTEKPGASTPLAKIDPYRESPD